VGFQVNQVVFPGARACFRGSRKVVLDSRPK
jgi:hypothetical protein